MPIFDQASTRPPPGTIWKRYTNEQPARTVTHADVVAGLSGLADSSRKNWRFSSFNWGTPSDVDADYRDYRNVDRAVDFVKESRRPSFLAVGFEGTHIPWYAPRRFFDLYPIEGVQVPDIDQRKITEIGQFMKRKFEKGRGDHAVIEEYGLWEEAIQAYLAAISFTDAQLGRLLNAIEETFGWENTLVIAVSDHGWHLGEKLHWRKGTLWEEATRVPLLFSGAGLSSGQDCTAVVSLVDVFPTLVEYFGLENTLHLSGQSFSKLLDDPSLSEASAARAPLTTWNEGNHALRTARWRYIRYRDGSEELYDHDTDPEETSNLAGSTDFQSVRDELAAMLQRMLA